MPLTAFQRLRTVFLVVSMILMLGTLGYVAVEGWEISDGLFMTVITMSTVGYGETQDLSPVGRIFTSILIFICLIGMTYWSAVWTSLVIEADLTGSNLKRKLRKMISKLDDHIIVCGSNEMAHAVVERLVGKGLQVVIVDQDSEQIEKIQKRFRGVLWVNGDPTNEMTLADANLMCAKAVVASTDSDVDNLLIGITCKDMDEDIQVYANANDKMLANRMRKAGIDDVVSPCQLCGNRMAELITE